MRKEVRKHVRSLLRQMQKKDRDEGCTRSHDEKRENRAQGNLRGLRYLRPELLEGQKIGNSLARRFRSTLLKSPRKAIYLFFFRMEMNRTKQTCNAGSHHARIALAPAHLPVRWASFRQAAYLGMARHDG